MSIGVSLNTPDERCTWQVRMLGLVGFIFLALPILVPWRIFWFFLLYLGSAAPNYSRKPPYEINQKNRGHALPHPCHPLPNLASEPRSMGVFRHFLSRGVRFPTPTIRRAIKNICMYLIGLFITLFGSITMFSGTNNSAREVYGHIKSVKILLMLNPTNYMLTYSGFALFIWGIFYRFL